MSNVACRVCWWVGSTGLLQLFSVAFWKTLHGVARALIVRPRTLWFLIWWKILAISIPLLHSPLISLSFNGASDPLWRQLKSQKSHSRCTRTGGPSIGTVQIVRNRRHSRISIVSSPPDISCVLSVSLQFILSFYRFSSLPQWLFFRGSGNYKTFFEKKLHFMTNFTVHGWITRRCQSQSYGNAQTKLEIFTKRFSSVTKFWVTDLIRCFVALFGYFSEVQPIAILLVSIISCFRDLSSQSALKKANLSS